MSGEHVEINKAHWDDVADYWATLGARLWALDSPEWGNMGLPDGDVPMLPADMTGMDAIELGCGTGYVSGWMSRRGANVTAIDVSPRQLNTARQFAKKHDAKITFLEGNAEATGLPDASFDFAVSEYGAAIWCDPDLWLREAYRLLRPGGHLSFLGNHPLCIITTPANGAASDYTLHRPYRDMDRLDWTKVEIDPCGMSFNRSFEGWIKLFHDIGFRIKDYQELYARDTEERDLGHVTAEWAKKYPSEQVWWLERPAKK